MMIYPSDAMTDYETIDFTINGMETVVDYIVTETKSVPQTREVFTDLGHGEFSQKDLPDGEKEVIVDVEIIDWCYPDESPYNWTGEDKMAFVSWLRWKMG